MENITPAEKASALKFLASLAVSTGVVQADKRSNAIALKIVYDAITAEDIASSPELANATCEVMSLIGTETLQLHDRIRASLRSSGVPEDVITIIIAAL